MAKYFASEAALENSIEGMRIHGANGYSREYPSGSALSSFDDDATREGVTCVNLIVPTNDRFAPTAVAPARSVFDPSDQTVKRKVRWRKTDNFPQPPMTIQRFLIPINQVLALNSFKQKDSCDSALRTNQSCARTAERSCARPSPRAIRKGRRNREPGIKRNVRQGEAISEHIRPPSEALCH
jgi:hypothetical protein